MRRTIVFAFAGALALTSAGLFAQGPKPQPPARFVYVGDVDLAPFDYLDEDGRPTGFSVDLIRALAADAGVEVEIRLGEWNKVRAEFDSGNADLISLSYSEERAREYLWLARTWSVQQSLLFRPRSGAYPSGIDALAGESLAVQERSLVAEMLIGLKPPRPTVVTVAAQAETLRLLQDGVVTGVGGGSLVLRVAAARMGLSEFVELPLRTVPYGLVARKGRVVELSWVPASMERLREAGTLDALAEKHLLNPARPRTLWSYRYWALSILVLGLLAATGAVSWNRALLRSVRLRTQEMEGAMARSESLVQSLAANEKRFQTFLALSGEGITRFELEEPLDVQKPHQVQVAHILEHARLVEANEALARMVQTASAKDLVGLRLGQVSSGPEAEEVMRLFVSQGYRLSNQEGRRVRRNGEVRWVSGNVVGIVEDGLLKGIWSTQQDISARKEAEERLRVRGQIMEAVAFSSTALLEPGPWKALVPVVLERLGEAAGAGCVFIRENISEGSALYSTLRQEWTAPAFPSLQSDPLFQQFEWPEQGPIRIRLEQRRIVPVLVRELPPEAQEMGDRMGLKSLLMVPIFVGDQWWGLLGFGDYESERAWSDVETEALKTAGTALGAALLRERVETAVHASERKHRDIVAFAPAGIYQTTREGTVVMANQEFARLLGYRRTDEVIGLNMARDVYFDPAERERLIQAHRTQPHSTPVEVRLRRRDGQPFWGEMSAHMIKDASGKTVLLEGFVQDITARKAAEVEQERFGLALERAAEEWHRTFDAVDVAIIVLDWVGRLTRINRHALSMLTPVFGEVLGRSVRELADQEPWIKALEAVERVVQTRGPASARAVDSAAGKTWELTAYLAQAAKGGGERIILMVRDISRLVELQQSLRYSETMSAMGSLVAGVAHEVRNPLFSISATVDALESELGDQQEYAELTGLLRSQVNRLRQLMRDLLDYGKPPVLRLAPVPCREVARRAARACAGLANERRVHLVEEVPADMPLIQVDSSRMEQVFQNLLANAIQHSPRDATVRVIARVRDDGSPELRVEDEGTGIPLADMPDLFAPFFSRRKGGTGLGLPVVQRIVEAHGGRVVAANREGGGAVFTVTLPPGVVEKPGHPSQSKSEDKTEDKTEVGHG